MEALIQPKRMDLRADFSSDEGVPLKSTDKIADVLCVPQNFNTKSGGKAAVKTCTAIDSAFFINRRLKEGKL